MIHLRWHTEKCCWYTLGIWNSPCLTMWLRKANRDQNKTNFKTSSRLSSFARGASAFSPPLCGFPQTTTGPLQDQMEKAAREASSTRVLCTRATVGGGATSSWIFVDLEGKTSNVPMVFVMFLNNISGFNHSKRHNQIKMRWKQNYSNTWASSLTVASRKFFLYCISWLPGNLCCEVQHGNPKWSCCNWYSCRWLSCTGVIFRFHGSDLSGDIGSVVYQMVLKYHFFPLFRGYEMVTADLQFTLP